MTRSAVAHLRKVDPVFRELIGRVGPCRFAPKTDGTHFAHVTRAIVFQQLSGKAASTIHGRLLQLFDGTAPTPSQLLAIRPDALRAVGLSGQKTSYVRDLAEHCVRGGLEIESLHIHDDDEIIRQLTAVKGVGRWTAQMFLMFRLGRADVLPEADLGLQNAVRRAWSLRARPTPKQLLRRGEAWRPYRTIASWYLWRSLDAAGAEV